MLNVRLAGDHLYRKLLSLVVSVRVSFAVIFSTGYFGGIRDLIKSVSEGFHTTHSCII